MHIHKLLTTTLGYPSLVMTTPDELSSLNAHHQRQSSMLEMQNKVKTLSDIPGFFPVALRSNLFKIVGLL